MANLTREERLERERLAASRAAQSRAGDADIEVQIDGEQGARGQMRDADAVEGTGDPVYDRRHQQASRGNVRSSDRAGVRDPREVAAQIRGNPIAAEEGHDKFYIDPDEIPTGWTYTWRRGTTAGKDDRQYMNSLLRRGWEPVPQDRHPDIECEQDGMILMEIPTEIFEDMQNRDKVRAKMQVISKEAQLAGETPEGTLQRKSFNGKTGVTKSYEAIPD